MFSLFELTLVVNHACNLRCTYCYTGEKFHRRMSLKLGEQAIDRAIASLTAGGTLDLAFFGGEPLVEAASILHWMEYAEQTAVKLGIQCRFSMTTNGTITTGDAWRVLTHSAMSVSVSCDGPPAVHDKHRLSIDGRGTSSQVLASVCKLQEAGKELNVITVVRPDTVSQLPDTILWLFAQQVSCLTLSLDLWTYWHRDDAVTLGRAITESAKVWSDHKPNRHINWFDDAARKLLQLKITTTQRCGFGEGQIAVTPLGHLYPCERIIHEDRAEHPLRLAGHVSDGPDFCQIQSFPPRQDPECSDCSLLPLCGATCRCSNYVRTGDVQRPDGLLCWLETKTLEETGRILNQTPNWLKVLTCVNSPAEDKNTGLLFSAGVNCHEP